MNFGEALELIKQGKLVTRKGWNGKDMFIFQRPFDQIQKNDIQNIKSLPQAVKDYFSSCNPIFGNFPVNFTKYLCMKTADNSIVNGWLASQTDMLSEDWEEYIVK